MREIGLVGPPAHAGAASADSAEAAYGSARCWDCGDYRRSSCRRFIYTLLNPMLRAMIRSMIRLAFSWGGGWFYAAGNSRPYTGVGGRLRSLARRDAIKELIGHSEGDGNPIARCEVRYGAEIMDGPPPLSTAITVFRARPMPAQPVGLSRRAPVANSCAVVPGATFVVLRSRTSHSWARAPGPPEMATSNRQSPGSR
jgi:hypothetical protein